MNKWWIYILIFILLFAGVLFGIWNYNKKQTEEIKLIENKQLANENTTIQTSMAEEKISPNAMVIQKKYYIGCDHLIKEIANIPDALINKTKQDLKDYYQDWTIDNYSSTEITIYKEEKRFL